MNTEQRDCLECGRCDCCVARSRAIHEAMTAAAEPAELLPAMAHSVIRRRAGRPQDWREFAVAREVLASHDAEPPTPEWLAAVGAQQLDPHHPNEWSVIVPRAVNPCDISHRLTVCLDGAGPGVTWDEVGQDGEVEECVTLVFADLTRGRFRNLCRAVGAPLREAR